MRDDSGGGSAAPCPSFRAAAGYDDDRGKEGGKLFAPPPTPLPPPPALPLTVTVELPSLALPDFIIFHARRPRLVDRAVAGGRGCVRCINLV